jgi:hypothetical protein
MARFVESAGSGVEAPAPAAVAAPVQQAPAHSRSNSASSAAALVAPAAAPAPALSPPPPQFDLLSLDDPQPAAAPGAAPAPSVAAGGAAWDPFAPPAEAQGQADPNHGWDIFRSSSSSLPALEAAAAAPAPPAAAPAAAASAAAVDPFAEIIRPGSSSASLASSADPFALPAPTASTPAPAAVLPEQPAAPPRAATPAVVGMGAGAGATPTAHKPTMSHENILALFDKPTHQQQLSFTGDFGGFVSAPSPSLQPVQPMVSRALRNSRL